MDITPGTLRLSFPVFLLAVPLIDTLKVMTIRLWKNKNPFLPDKSHLHHLILGQNIRDKSTVFIILTFTIAFLTNSLIYLRYSRILGNIIFFILGIILISMKWLLARSSAILQFEEAYRSLFNLSKVNSVLFRNLFIFFSSVITVFVTVSFIPSASQIDKKVVVVLFFSILLLFLSSLFNYKKTSQFNDIYVFINIIVFLMLGYFSDSLIGLKYFHKELFDNFFVVGIVTLLGLVILFIMSRDHHLNESQTLFSGLDLILMAFILLVFIYNQIMGIGAYTFIGLNGFYALIIYTWYKIISTIKAKYSRPLFYVSFIFPIFSLVLIYFNL